MTPPSASRTPPRAGAQGGKKVIALSGGVGGAKLALGLSRVLPADELLVIANTGDDFEHLGLRSEEHTSELQSH